MKLSGAQYSSSHRKKEGVEVLFGTPAGRVLPIFDKLYDARQIHPAAAMSKGAAHAADGYARATGKVGVCLATSGPGPTKPGHGLATAYMDRLRTPLPAGQIIPYRQ